MKSEPGNKMAYKNNKMILANDILIVNNETSNLQLLTQLLSKAGYQIRPAERPQIAIDSALAQPPALILLDVRIPEIDGFEVCKRLKQDEHTRNVPIIFITALEGMQDKVRGFAAGCADFITKPFQEEEVLARVQTHIELRNLQLNLEEIISDRTNKLMESESRFRATFEQAAVGIAHLSLEGNFLRVNTKFCEIVGYSEDEIHALTFQEITHPDDLETDLDYVRQVLEGARESYSMDKRYYQKNGSIIWINLTVSLVFDKEGHQKYFVAVIKDISERKQAEYDLQESHGFLKHLTSAVPDAIYSIKLPERTIKWANDSFNVMGYEDDEYIGQPVEKYYASPEEYSRVGALQREAISKGEKMIRTEAMVRRKDGMIIPMELTATFFMEEGKLSLITAMVRDISERKLAEKKLKKSFQEIKALQKQLQAESAYLQEEIKLEHNFENIIGQSEELKYVLHRVEQVAPQNSTVLILGETGTGKELIARALHQLSSRRKRPLVKVNCAALPSELIESELFGREKGAYTGATTTQIGRFELAHGSTLFLDEIGELPLALQAKLLRVIESGEFERLGSSRTIKSDTRIIAATNRNLEEEVHNNRFREDLMYRLRIFPITVPPLRDRTDDIPLLVNEFVQFFARTMGKSPALKISKRSMQKLQSYSWPGNVRELKHIIEGSMIAAQGNKLYFDLPKGGDSTKGDFKSLDELERQYIFEVLQANHWKIAGENSASSILEMHPNTLRSRMKKLGIKKP